MRHLIDVKKRIVKCGTCHRRIWYAHDGGMPVYCETADVDVDTEIRARLTGVLTFVEIGSYLAMRNHFNVGPNDIVHIAHPHRGSIIEIERTTECPTETRNAATDFNAPY